MKSMMSAAPGGPECLQLTKSPTPTPGPGEVRIAVKAAGVNFPDTLIIRDQYQIRPPRPFAPGGEVAGLVDALGSRVTAFKIGDRVLSGGVNGGYATHFIAHAERVSAIPDTMPFEEAAAFALTYGTSYYALMDRAAIASGETLFVLGAAGGVGAAAIELGNVLGARVIAAVSSDEKAVFCRELGAADTLVYPKGALDRDGQKALTAEIKYLCGGEGADVVLDAVGGDYAEAALRALVWNGRFLVVGFPAGIPKIPLNLSLLKSCQIVGVFWGAFRTREPARNHALVADLLAMYAEGKIRPRITARFPLERAGEALAMLESRSAMGKIVLTVD